MWVSVASSLVVVSLLLVAVPSPRRLAVAELLRASRSSGSEALCLASDLDYCVDAAPVVLAPGPHTYRFARALIDREDLDEQRKMQILAPILPTHFSSQLELDWLLTHASGTDLVHLLLQAGANPNCFRLPDQLSMLRRAVQRRNLALVELFLNFGARVDSDTLADAAELELFSEPTTDLLLSFVAESDEIDFGRGLELRQLDLELLIAIRRQHLGDVIRLIEAGANVSCAPKSNRGFYSPFNTLQSLQRDSNGVKKKMQQLLIAHGAQTNRSENSLRGNEIVSEFAKINVEPRPSLPVENTILHGSLESLDSDVEQQIIFDSAPLENMNFFFSPLMALALTDQRLDKAQLSLKIQSLQLSQIEHCSANGVTALFWAIQQSREFLSSLLLNRSRVVRCRPRELAYTIASGPILESLLASSSLTDLWIHGFLFRAVWTFAKQYAWILVALVCFILLLRALAALRPASSHCGICLATDIETNFGFSHGSSVHRIGCQSCVLQLDSCPLCRQEGTLVRITGF